MQLTLRSLRTIIFAAIFAVLAFGSAQSAFALTPPPPFLQWHQK